jgi:hypothetical protein
MDMHTKHTPGPWLIEGRGPCTIYANVSLESTAGRPKNDPARWTEKRIICKAWQGNAALIAAAPELYAALAFMVSQIEDPENKNHTLGAYTHGNGVNMARAALAKAREEQP